MPGFLSGGRPGRNSRWALYVALGALAVFFMFPFYWVAMSSLKTPAGMALVPPAFYPCEARTADLVLKAAGLVWEAESSAWLKLTAAEDPTGATRAQGGFFLRLDAGAPSQFVQWLPDAGLKPAAIQPDTLAFAKSPLCAITGRGAPAVRLARMVRQQASRSEEWLFVVEETAARVDDCVALRDPRYRDLRAFRARWENYAETLKGPEATFGAKSGGGFLLFLRNSLLISILAVLGQLFTSSLVAFGFSRLRFKGRDFLFVVLLATLMIPGQVTFIPLFAIYRKLGWVDTFLPLIVPHFTAGAFNVFLLRQYMLTLPRGLDEAAEIDGCSVWQTYWRVILPNCTAVLVVVGIFTFVWTWEDVMGPLVYLDNPAYRTVPLGLEYFRSPYVDNRHLLMTGAVLAMAPVALLFLVFQRYIMAGIATTGIKG